jgi:hypothetical protein
MIAKWTPEYCKQYDAEYRAKNKEHRKQYMKQYREDHRREISDKKRELYRISKFGESENNLNLLISQRNEYLKRTV